jgi:hypothetical protein
MIHYLSTIFKTVLIFLMFYGVYYLALMVINKKKEGFLNFPNSYLSPGEFPLTVDKPLLQGDYNLKTPPYLSALNASDIYKEYPIFPAHSTEINNIRYWTKPENGTCSRAEVCGYLYEDYTDQHIPPPLTPPGWNKRVNFYEEDY